MTVNSKKNKKVYEKGKVINIEWLLHSSNDENTEYVLKPKLCYKYIGRMVDGEEEEIGTLNPQLSQWEVKYLKKS